MLGSLQFVFITGATMTFNADDPNQKQAFEYAWNYFTVHSGQRMQTINFFIVAVAFLFSAFVDSAASSRHWLAFGVALLGCAVCLIFYRMDRRTRDLIKASEDALKEVESDLAKSITPDLADNAVGKFQILSLVENSQPGAWSYSRVVRFLFGASALAFFAGAIYSLLNLGGLSPDQIPIAKSAIHFAIGLALLFAAVEFFDFVERRFSVRNIVSCLLLASGVVVLLDLAFRRIW